MKVFLVALSAIAADAATAIYGPNNCVSLDRSSAGSCLLKTNCAGQDTSKFEFAFDCLASVNPVKHIQRHSFGLGGFDDSEEFDTEVKCIQCGTPGSLEAPSAVAVADAAAKPVAAAQAAAVQAEEDSDENEDSPVPVAKAPTSAVQAVAPTAPADSHALVVSASSTANLVNQGAAAKKMWPFTSDTKTVAAPSAKSEVTKYGPKDCVSTYKDEAKGTCIMQTNCEDIPDAELSSYNYGLICVDEHGVPMRHVFGKDSFDRVETFDTLIKCDRCIGHDDVAEEVALVGQVEVLRNQVKDLKDMMKNITTDVEQLNTAVFPTTAAPAAAPNASANATTTAAPATTAAPPAALVHSSSSHRQKIHRTHHRHHKRKIHHRRVAEDGSQDEEEVTERRHLRHSKHAKKHHHKHAAKRMRHVREEDESADERSEEQAEAQNEQESEESQEDSDMMQQDPDQPEVVSHKSAKAHGRKHVATVAHEEDEEAEVGAYSAPPADDDSENAAAAAEDEAEQGSIGADDTATTAVDNGNAVSADVDDGFDQGVEDA